MGQPAIPTEYWQPELVQVLDEGMGAGGGVAKYQHPATLTGRQLGQRVGENADVIGGVVRIRLARVQQPGQALPVAARTMVKEGEQRSEPEAA